MHVVLVVSRCPWPPHTGDRARAGLWLRALEGTARVTVIAPECSCETGGVIRVRRSISRLLVAIPKALLRGLPLHTLAVAGYDWPRALRAAGAIETAIVLLSRTEPWVGASIESLAKRRILDAIDSATAGMRERADAAPRWLAWLWRSESRKMARLEREASSRYDAITTVADAENAPFGDKAFTIPMGIDVAELANEERVFDFGFSGRMGYFANAEAARTLVHTIWPRIRALRPAATLFLGGADAPADLLRMDGRDGITIVSPVDDIRAALRRVRVALLPILHGTGQSMKTMEAAEAGCAIAGTPLAFRALPDLEALAVVEADLARLAERAVALLDADPRAAGMQLREAVIREHSRSRTLRRMAGIAMGESLPC